MGSNFLGFILVIGSMLMGVSLVMNASPETIMGTSIGLVGFVIGMMVACFLFEKGWYEK